MWRRLVLWVNIMLLAFVLHFLRFCYIRDYQEMSRFIENFPVEDKDFWQREGKTIATRNLWVSIPSLLFAFVVWQLWSVLIVFLPQIGFTYTVSELTYLAALPSLSGATLRIFYAFMVPIFGGRIWTVISTASLLIPLFGIAYFIQDPTTPFITMMILALLCGFGGANFSSSMANIGYFFPKAEKGKATGMNAGLGNLGVSVVQFVVPAVIGLSIFGSIAGLPQTSVNADGSTSEIYLQNAAIIFIPFVAVCTIAALFCMNDLGNAKASFKEQSIIFHRKDTWIMCVLYIGTFGSFIGMSAAFPFLIKQSFVDVNPLSYAFLGPLVGSITRIVGGILSDKLGGHKVTHYSFIFMILSTLGIIYALPSEGSSGSFGLFFTFSMLLFIFIGFGNGSTFAQVPAIFADFHRQRTPASTKEEEAALVVKINKESGAVLGFIGAIGAYGGFIVPRLNGVAIEMTGSIIPAFYCLLGFYVVCVVINKLCYYKKK